jgi:hypothetical protein
MAERLLFIGWGQVVRGREEHGLEVFDETVAFFGRCRQEGRIEAFDVVLLGPNPALNGYMELHGTPEQLAALREDDEFRRMIANAQLVVDDLSIVDAYANAGIARQLEVFREAAGRVPQAH